MIVHVRFTCAADYNERRLPHRPAHLAQLAALRAEGRVVAGGPEPDGSAAHIFYRVADLAELERLLDDNVFQKAGLFAARHPRAFTEFLEPTAPPPLDAGLKVTLVEGTPLDRGLARARLADLQREKRAAFGGFFTDGACLAALTTPNRDEAVLWLTAAGGWDVAGVRGRAWSQTL
ncbi:MAG TPA: YciI family protein [Candidatus Binatia bacterium]|nr:YciI family protein [Candidatus Binatia bacterium]